MKKILMICTVVLLLASGCSDQFYIGEHPLIFIEDVTVSLADSSGADYSYSLDFALSDYVGDNFDSDYTGIDSAKYSRVFYGVNEVIGQDPLSGEILSIVADVYAYNGMIVQRSPASSTSGDTFTEYFMCSVIWGEIGMAHYDADDPAQTANLRIDDLENAIVLDTKLVSIDVTVP